MGSTRNSERRTAGRYGARRQPGSGNRPAPGLKGDVIHKEFLLEQKDPQTEKIKLAAADLDTLWKQGVRLGKMPVFLIVSPSIRWESLVILDANDFHGRSVESRCVKTLTIRRHKTLYFGKIQDLLLDVQDEHGRGKDAPVAYITLTAPEREYVILDQNQFDTVFEFHQH